MRDGEIRTLPPWGTEAAGVAWVLTAGPVAPTSHSPGSPLGTVVAAGGGKRSPTHNPWSGVPQGAWHSHPGLPGSPGPGTPLLGEVWLQPVWKKTNEKSKAQRDHYYRPLKKVLVF